MRPCNVWPVDTDWNRRVCLVWLLLIAAAPTAGADATPERDVQPVVCSSTSDKKCAPKESTLQTAVKESAERNLMKPGTAVKDLFKDLRPGACKPTMLSAPNTSWPARGDAAISFCRQ
jgi:hypothetical protein